MAEPESAVVYTLENVEYFDDRLLPEQSPGQVSDEDITEEERIIKSFSQKFLSYFESDLNNINEKLCDVQQNQNVLIESLSQEREKLAKCAVESEVEKAMAQINHYRMKLCRIRSNMVALKEHSNRYAFIFFLYRYSTGCESKSFARIFNGAC